MKQPLLPSTISTQSHFAQFLTITTVVRKFGKSDGQTRSNCLDKAVLAHWGGGASVAQGNHSKKNQNAHANAR